MTSKINDFFPLEARENECSGKPIQMVRLPLKIWEQRYNI